MPRVKDTAQSTSKLGGGSRYWSLKRSRDWFSWHVEALKLGKRPVYSMPSVANCSKIT